MGGFWWPFERHTVYLVFYLDPTAAVIMIGQKLHSTSALFDKIPQDWPCALKVFQVMSFRDYRSASFEVSWCYWFLVRRILGLNVEAQTDHETASSPLLKKVSLEEISPLLKPTDGIQ